MQIFVVTENNKKFCNLDCESEDTIGEVKEKIQDKEGIPPDYQIITHAGTLLNNDKKTLDEYGIKNEHTLLFKIIDKY